MRRVRSFPRAPRAILALAAAGLLAGCTGIGPRAVVTDQADYAVALRDARKSQLLQSIVAVRNGDIPSFVRVDQIVAGYERRVVGSAGNVLGTDFLFNSDFNVFAEGSFADRPTFTLKPLQGVDYARVVLRPVTPADLLALASGGADLRALFGLAVQSINGVVNQRLPGPPPEPGSSGDFDTLISALTRMRDAGRLLMEFERDADTGAAVAYLTILDDPSGRASADAQTARRLLRLPEGDERHPVTLAQARRAPASIAIQTRPLIEILDDAGRTILAEDSEEPYFLTGDWRRPPGVIVIRRTDRAPLLHGAYAATEYNGDYFWIDADDAPSKASFAMLMLLATVMEQTSSEANPVLMIPTN
ncbi:hypothetical protein [Albimonas pacifica]|uniref:Beta-barrel assembly machine subunit BamC n=1 Tax=Albimonas pacifica TaxID=1114924 RepID=A0A1I3H2P8_9RHOB|nr:hypothetical protein [Albimonas pacifica]SFI29994.1 hypothetical protein SAMN05216258_105472 [Albimonas pacifica]